MAEEKTYGHVWCCDSSPKSACDQDFRQTQHPIIEGYDPPEGWGWCYVDEITLDLSRAHDTAAQADPAHATLPPDRL